MIVARHRCNDYLSHGPFYNKLSYSCLKLHLSERTAVAFSVALSQTTTLNGDIGVGFDHFLYGINCDYSPASRRFTARVSGLYEFHVTATGPADGKDLHLELWTNDRYIYTRVGHIYVHCVY